MVVGGGRMGGGRVVEFGGEKSEKGVEAKRE